MPALFTSIQAVLSLYASGRTTGIVMDAGDGVSHAVPVYEGFAVPSSIRRIDVAGRDVTEQLQMLLRKSGYVFHTSAEKEIVRHIKETTGYIALDPKKEEKEYNAARGRADKAEVDYTLPDGSKIKARTRPHGPAEHAADERRSARSASARQRFSSTRSSSGSSTRASSRWSSTPSAAPTWTCARTCTTTLCCRAAPR